MYRAAASDASSGVFPCPRVHVGAVPVPPVVRCVGFLVGVVMPGGFVEKVGEASDVHRQSFHSRPGSRVVISCSSHPLPSGSLNETYVW
jgi:hypothetical protein